MDADQDQGRDGQPLADHIMLRPDVNPFPPQRADIINSLSNLSTLWMMFQIEWNSYPTSSHLYTSKLTLNMIQGR